MENLNINIQICSHKSCLEGFALRFTNDVEDANDLVQDTIIKAISYRHLYKSGTNLRGWLYTIMKNTFINDYRKNSRREKVIQVSEDLNSYQLQGSADNNKGINAFMKEDINKAFKNLHPIYAKPFLRYFEGYKYHEIAKELSIPMGTVKTRIHIARQLLKDQLKMYKDSYRISSKVA